MKAICTHNLSKISGGSDTDPSELPYCVGQELGKLVNLQLWIAVTDFIPYLRHFDKYGPQ